MRITEKQRQAFVNSINELGVRQFEIYLYGSRAVARKKGGDIDLLIIASAQDIQKLSDQKQILLAKMKLKTDDEKIDITLVAKERKEMDTFLKSIPQNELIKLN